MKKIISSLLLIICILLTFVGCTDKNSQEVTFDNNIEAQKLKSKNSKLYALVFDSVWKMDEGLNYKVKYISVNTKSFKDFSNEDKKQLFDYIAKKYNATVLDMNMDELKNAGYVKNLTFEEGILFQVEEYKTYSSSSVSFGAMKWRSSLGATGTSFEGEYKKNKWKLKKSNMEWIS